MRVLSRIVFALGVVAMLIGLVSGVVNRQVLDADRFASHVDAIRADPEVARQIGDLVTDQLLEAEPDLVIFRPLIESVSATLVASSTLKPVVRTTVAPLHRALTTGDDGQIVLRLADVGALLVAAINSLSPELRATIPADLDVQLSRIGGHELSTDLIGVAHLVGILSWLLPVLGLLLLAGSGALQARDARRIGRSVGQGLLVTAGALAVLLVLGAWFARSVDGSGVTRTVLAAAWGELDESFWTMAAVSAAAGFLLVLVASPDFVLDRATMMSRARGWLVRRRSVPKDRAVGGLIAVVLGGLAIARPLVVLAAAVGIVGALLILIGLRDVVLAVATVLRTRARRAIPAKEVTYDLGVRIVAGLAATALVFVVIGGALPASSELTTSQPQSATDGPCNGHEQLCARPYDQVSFPATHNSMSAATTPGWFLAEQPDGVIQQLDHGIRVFLIDSWPGQETQRSGVVATAGSSREAALAEAEATYGPEVLASALRLRDSLNLTPRGKVRPYLCHAMCELGSTEWAPLMSEVRAWLDAHPREVVTFFVQDEVSPADTAKVVDDAGLLPYIHTQREGEAWPSLGSMIATGERVVFLMENTPGGAEYPWLLDAKTFVQDTPFLFRSAEEFTCEAFRGKPDSPLFLVNHWVSSTASRVTNAATVNARDVLLSRLRECEQERGRIPNYVAVDFYDQGDLFDSVDELNGLS